MKNNLKNFLFASMALILVFNLSSCGGGTIEEDDKEMLEILDVYTNNTVIKTYNLLANNAIDLFELCENLQESPTDANVLAAANKWKEARKYWELSEAFLYGPAEYNSLDPRIDSWPLDKNTLDQELAKDMTGVDAPHARVYYGVNLIGFHAIEYVLFENGQAKDVSKITTNELIYLVAVAGVLMEDCVLLEASWTDDISSTKKRILEEAELEISSNFGYEMLNAGSAGSRFKTPQQAVREIIGGCETIADEVGNEKIADPYETKNVLRVESWYSWNSLDDFTNNIISIENSYLGGMEGYRTGKSLSDYVNSKNEQLDKDILEAIETAINAIKDIPSPFRNQLDNPASAPMIEAAMDACNNLLDQLSLIDEVVE